MEACDTSMEKFYATMHKIKDTKHVDILLKRMINHVRKTDFIYILKKNDVSNDRLLMHYNFLNQKEYFIEMLNHRIF